MGRERKKEAYRIVSRIIVSRMFQVNILLIFLVVSNKICTFADALWLPPML